MKRGYFISFEGIDGSGKTTQLRLLLAKLDQKGLDYVLCREPGGTPLGEEIRELLLAKKDLAIDPKAELLLFCAARRELIKEVIEPNLRAGKLVISDRFSDSTLAYQGGARGLGIDTCKLLLDLGCGPCWPDRTYLFDLPIAEAKKRRGTRDLDDRIEEAGDLFMAKVREAYLELAEKEKERIVRIDARQSIEAQADLLVNDLIKQGLSLL